jgi:hypothetical protein
MGIAMALYCQLTIVYISLYGHYNYAINMLLSHVYIIGEKIMKLKAIV